MKSPLGHAALPGSRVENNLGTGGCPVPEAVRAAQARSLLPLPVYQAQAPASRPKPHSGSLEAVPLPNTLYLEFSLTLPTYLLGPSLNVTPPLSGRPQRAASSLSICQSWAF